MRDIEEAILKVFKSNSTKELNTDILAKEVYPREYALAENLMKSSEKIMLHDGKRQKFQLHRKLLYYVNKLIDNNIIKVSKIAEKGEKYFILNTEEGDTIIGKGYKKIVVNKPTVLTTEIEPYESKGLMKKFEEDSWINRFNSILLECKGLDTTKLYKNISECFTNINDTIALNEYENIINISGEESHKEFVEKLSRDSENFDKSVAIIINLTQTNNNIIPFIDTYTKINPKHMNVIFNISNKEIQKNSKIISHIFEKFSDSKIKINFKNNDLNNSPFFKGRAGIYNFDEQNWNKYIQTAKGKVIGISCSQSQIAVNINKFFEVYSTDAQFRQSIISAAKTLLLANTIQRRKSNEYFRNVNNINGLNSSDFYKFSRNYIRFWNYDWHKDIQENNNLIDLIRSTKELVDSFCYNEEAIFKSCGIPIKFKIAFSSAFRNFDAKFMGEREYKKVTVNKTEDFYSGETKRFLQAREKMFEIFDGGDRLRIFRNSNFAMTEILHELGILLNAYKIPFFTYDFSGLKGTVKLTNFM